MELSELLKKADELNKKEKLAKKQEAEEKSTNIKINYQVAKERLNEKLENPNVTNILKIFNNIGTLPKKWNYASRGFDAPINLLGKPLFNMLCASGYQNHSDTCDNKIAFLVTTDYRYEITSSSLIYRWNSKWNQGSYKCYIANLIIDKDENAKVLFSVGYDNWSPSSLNEDNLKDEYLEIKTDLINHFCDKLEPFIQQASCVLEKYFNEKEIQYGNIELNKKEETKKILTGNNPKPYDEFVDALIKSARESLELDPSLEIGEAIKEGYLCMDYKGDEKEAEEEEIEI